MFNLTAKDLTREDETTFYSYRGKGGKYGKRELPQPAIEAIRLALAAPGKDLFSMMPKESLWPSSTDSGRGITSGAFYGNLRRYMRAAGLPLADLHVFRHAAAKLRREAGESVEQVSRFLDHSSLAVTWVYLGQLEGARDTTWQQVAVNLGILGARGIQSFQPMHRGQWLAPYTGTTVRLAGDLDIGHTVPLANAHKSGGWAWSAERKRAYANDLLFDGHLIAVTVQPTAPREQKSGRVATARFEPLV